MTMSVTTPIIPTTAPVDGGAATASGAQSATDGEFADALAGFLDGGPGTGGSDGETTSPEDATAPAVPMPGPDMVATTTPLWLASAEVFPTVITPASLAPATQVSTQDAVGALAAAAPPAAVSAHATDESAAAFTDAVTAASAGAATGSVADTATGVTPPVTAAAVASPPTDQTATAPVTRAGTSTSPANGVDVQSAMSVLGLTLTSESQTSAETGTGADGNNPGSDTAAASTAALGGTALAGEPATGVALGQSTAPTTAAASALNAVAPGSGAPRSAHVAHQVATQVATLVAAPNGVHTMTIQITPDDLGPVQVQVTLTDGVVDMTVLTALEVGRDTITQAAPDLRRYLEAAGLTCNNVEVDLSNDQSSWLTQPDAEQNFEERQPTNGREQAGTPSGDTDDNPRVVAATRSPSSTSSGVDLQM